MYKYEVEESGTLFPILDWTGGECEAGALEQAQELAMLPFVHQHVALMPDCHQGYGMPIGGVVGFKGVVSPFCVGNDIGCGMRVARLDYTAGLLDKRKLIDIRNTVKDVVPVNTPTHKEEQPWEGWDKWEFECNGNLGLYDFPKWHSPKTMSWIKRSLGTLGGGNHFIELQKSTMDKKLNVMIHTGSRNLGTQICNYYHKLALDMCNAWHIKLPNNHLAYLPVDSVEGQAYLRDMNFALAFAEMNRMRIMTRVLEIVAEMAGQELKVLNETDVHHNYAALENHMGKNVWVHRKGATSAKLGEIGIVPGDQGSYSYMVRGLGNFESLMSCSHGAGRVLGRKDAQRKLNLATEQEKLDRKGIVHTLNKVSDLDEASGAYKDISTVMENQADLVKITDELAPMVSIKGKK